MIICDRIIIFAQISIPFQGEYDSPVCCNLALRFDIIIEKKLQSAAQCVGGDLCRGCLGDEEIVKLRQTVIWGFYSTRQKKVKLGFRSTAFEPQGHLLVITSACSPSPPPCSISHPHTHRALHNLWRLAARAKVTETNQRALTHTVCMCVCVCASPHDVTMCKHWRPFREAPDETEGGRSEGRLSGVGY